MSELHESIPISVSLTPSTTHSYRKSDAANRAVIKQPLRWNMQRLSYIAFATMMMAFAAWGTSRYFSIAARIEDDESIADLEGFDSAPAFAGKSSHDSASSTGLGPAMPILSAPTPDVTSQDLNNFLSVNSVPQADVWLTGTIEEIDSVDTIPLPDQISEKPSETSVFR